jgi:hypothetical protein
MSYYHVLDTLKNHLDNDPFVNTVSEGSVYKIDLNKQTIFPLSHIVVNSSTFIDNVIQLNVSIMAMDVLDISKDEPDAFRGNDNEQDIMNTQLAVLNRLYESLRRGDLYSDNFQIVGTANCEPFTDRFESGIAVWTMTLDVQIPNEMTIC